DHGTPPTRVAADWETAGGFHLYGRRRGRPLRPGRREAVESLLPRLRVDLPPGADPIDPVRLFDPRPAEVWLEIGFGAGEHLAWQAARHPNIGFIGCEPFIAGVGALLARVAREDLRNVRILPDDARPLLWRLAEGSIGRAFILFPDPWPKARHHKRRIVARPVLDRLASAMRDGAELRLATDDVDYLRWMLEKTTDHPAFEWLVRNPSDWRERTDDWPATRYEEKALRQGRRPTYLRFRRRPR